MSKLNTAEDVFVAMKAIVEAPGYPLLKSYKQDLYKYDKEFLESAWHPKAQAVWVVRETGTHLNFVGMHERSCESALAAINAAGQSGKCYSVSVNGIKEISATAAKDLAKKIVWSMGNGRVIHDGRTVATYKSDLRWHEGNLTFDIDFESDTLDLDIQGTRSLLVMLAEHEGVKVSQSLFVRPGNYRLNGRWFTHKDCAPQGEQHLAA